VKTESGQPLKLGFSPCSSTIWKSHFPGWLFWRGCDLVCTGPLSANLVCKGKTMFKAKLKNNDVFLIKIEVVKGKSFPSAELSYWSQLDIDNLHRRAGNLSKNYLKWMFSLPSNKVNCEACTLSPIYKYTSKIISMSWICTLWFKWSN
jgi:hypothetical protein